MKHIRVVLLYPNGREHIEETHTKEINAYFIEADGEYTVIRTDLGYYTPPTRGSLEISVVDSREENNGRHTTS